MAIIYSYPLNTPKRDDLLIGTITYDEDAVNPVHGNPTVSFTVGSLLDLIASQGAAQNLQQVTNIGNTTTNSIVISNSLKVAGEYYDSSNQPGTAGQLLSSTATGTQWVNVAAQGVTSVGLSMPAAFTVTNSPITQSGTLTVTGAGTAAQYINGLGNLVTFPTIPTQYVLPVATTVALGGIKIGYTQNAKNYPIVLSNEQAYVNVPWTDTPYVLPLAADGTRGGVQIGYVENAKNYPVELSSEKMFVNVPWTDTPYVLPVATATDLGGVKIGYTENAKNYPVELDSDQMYVNVPWTDTQTVQTITGTGSDNTDSGVLLSDSGGTVKILGDGTVITAAQTGNTITLTGVNTWVANAVAVAGYVAAPAATDANLVWKTDANGNPAWRVDATIPDTGITGVTLAITDSTGAPLAESIASRELTLTSSKYVGGANVGYVPEGGTSSTYLKGDGTWEAIPTGLIFKGTWDASGTGGGNPDLTTLTPSDGWLYIVNVAGSAAPNGSGVAPNSWNLGDWCIYDGSAWTRVPATNAGVTSVTTTDGTFINLTPNAATTGAVTVTADLSAADGNSDTSTRFLSKDNTWDVPSYTTDSNTTYTVDVPTATTSINLKGSDGTDDAIVLTGGTNVTLSRTDASTIDIAATDTNTQNEYATSWVQSTDDILLRLTESGAGSGTQDIKIVKGANITFTYTDANNFTIAASDTQENTTWYIRDSANADKTVNNLKYLKFVTATGTLGTALTGAGTTSDPYLMTLTSPDTNTQLGVATSTVLGGIELGSDTVLTRTYETGVTGAENRTYPVQLNAARQAAVSVPWVSGGTYNWTIKDNATNPASSTVDSGETIQFVTATGALGTVLTEPSAGNFVMTLTSPDTDTTYSNFTAATAQAAGASGLVVAPPAGAEGKFLRGDATWVNETTYSTFTGADGTNAGTSGLVPAPTATDNVKFLKGDGTWAATPQGDITAIATTAPITGAATSGTATIAINTMGAATANAAGTKGAVPASVAGDQLKFLRADATWVVPTDTNTNTTYTIESANSKQISLVPSDVSGTASAANNYSNTNVIQVDTVVGTIANGYLIEGTGIPAGVFITNIQTAGGIRILTLSQAVTVANNTSFSFKARTAVTLADGSGITIGGNNDTITITNSDGDTGLPAIIVDDAQGNMSFGNANVTASTVRTKIGAGTGDGDVTLTGTQTLTNKTLTSPVIDVIEPSGAILTIKGDGSSIDAKIKLNCWNNNHGQTLSAQPHSAQITNTMLLPKGNSSTLVSEVSTSTLTNKSGNISMWTNDSGYITSYTLPLAADGTRGGIQIGYAESGKNYPVELSSEKAYVNVPWTDTVYTLPLAANGTRGGVQIGYSENGKNYPVELSSEKMFVNVPWTDNNSVDYINAATFNTGNGILTGTGVGNAGFSVDLDGRYVTSSGVTSVATGNGLSGGTITSTGTLTMSGSYSGDFSVTGTGWLTAEGNVANTNAPISYGIALGWNQSGGSAESNLWFRDNTTNHASNKLDISSYNGTSDVKVLRLHGNKLVDFNGNASAQGTTFLYNSGATSYLAANKYTLIGNHSNPTNTAATFYDQSGEGPTISGFAVCFRTGSTPAQTGKLNSSGTFTVSGDIVAYGSPSDIRLKENIKPIESALHKVSKLQGVTFNWKNKSEDILDIKEDIGFIAQDVQKVLPELVRENDNGMLSMRHQGITPILLEAIKELKAEIEELKLNNCNCNK